LGHGFVLLERKDLAVSAPALTGSQNR